MTQRDAHEFLQSIPGLFRSLIFAAAFQVGSRDLVAIANEFDWLLLQHLATDDYRNDQERSTTNTNSRKEPTP